MSTQSAAKMPRASSASEWMMHCVQSGVLRLQGELGREIEVLAGDVDGEDSAGLEMAAIERDGLRGEQVDRDRVAGEGIEHQHVVRWRSLVASDREARVAGNDAHRRRRVAQIGEEGAGEAFDEGIDFVEGDLVSGLAVGGEGAGAETDDADAAGMVFSNIDRGRGRLRSCGRSRTRAGCGDRCRRAGCRAGCVRDRGCG